MKKFIYSLILSIFAITTFAQTSEDINVTNLTKKQAKARIKQLEVEISAYSENLKELEAERSIVVNQMLNCKDEELLLELSANNKEMSRLAADLRREVIKDKAEVESLKQKYNLNKKPNRYPFSAEEYFATAAISMMGVYSAGMH